ncbi:RDD family protein [Psychrobacter lutiphocae]|uniref:RDD family protein n=1 Tax=Psychrobacter lutiphocae TaxID=540500 RepID=UPI0003646E56|nr:RDD family protein [Psychrobacter lutiphocae]
MQIYLARNSVQAGPYTLTELNNMLATDQVELTDLMWHEGMEQWRQVGEMTHGQYNYNPNAQPNQPQRRLTVAELYGQQPTDANHASSSPASSPFGTGAAQPKSTTANQAQYSKLQSTQTLTLANVGSRIAAVIIDQILAVLCMLPILSGLNFDFEQLQQAATDTVLITQLAESIPQHLALMSTVLILALFATQIFMLIRRGQSIGKLILGIRILDIQSKQVPSVTNIILMRTILTNVAYNIPTIGVVILIVDFVMMVSNKQRMSLHDKIAKTIVVKATPNQLKDKS